MAHDFDDVWAVCPYYKTQKAVEIYCEGIAGARLLKVIFGRKYDKQKYLMRYCNSIRGCRECALYRMREERRE